MQATDRHAGTLRSRIVLVDDDGVRATMTASWLVQMGWRDAVVLEGGIEGHALDTGMPAPPVLGMDERAWRVSPPARSRRRPASRGGATITGIAPDALAAALDRGEADVVDVSLSRAYRAGHIPGACHAVRARLARTLGGRSDPGIHGQAGNGIGRAFDDRSDPGVRGQAGDGLAWALGGRHSGRMLVFTSGGGTLALLAAAEAAAYVDAPVRALEGGSAGWAAAGYPLTAAEPRYLDDPDDVLIPIHEAEGGMEKAMNDYLDWEIALPGEVARDGTAAWLRTARGGPR